MTGGILETVTDVRSVSLDDVPTRRPHSTVVLVEPEFFDRRYVINPYMHGRVDSERARRQWDRLRAVYERHVDDLRVLDATATWERLCGTGTAVAPEELPDMVFVANRALPTADGEGLVLARMATEERAGEPAHFRAWAEAEGYRVHAPPRARFEGMGDALWHPGRRLLWGGHGVRTDREAYDELADRLDATVVPVELTDERYYHLDVCLAPLSESTALVQPEAFTEAGLGKVRALFDRVLEAPAAEAEGLAVNVESFGGTVVLGSDAPETGALLADAGYDVVEVDTGEFRKAGGSVCCLTLTAGVPA
jgi:N-dimethylarginine dimethylaminohydrolase